MASWIIVAIAWLMFGTTRWSLRILPILLLFGVSAGIVASIIGFRNPIPQGKALLVPLLNANEVILGRPAKFGEPIQLDLGGYGIRSIGRDKDKYLIIAGSHDSDGESRAYTWDGGSRAPVHMAGVRFPGLNPEGLAYSTADGRTEFFILSDDGTLKINGEDCKRIKNPAFRQFRGYALLP